MVTITKDIGTITKPKDKEPYGTRMVTSTEAISNKTCQMVKVSISAIMGESIKASSRIAYLTDKVRRKSRMVQNTSVSTVRGRSTAKAVKNGLAVISIKETGKKEK